VGRIGLRTRLSTGGRTSKQPHFFSVVCCQLSVSISIPDERKLKIENEKWVDLRLSLSQWLTKSVSKDASLFRRSHSNPVRNFRLSPIMHFGTVHHFHRFSFLPLSKCLATRVYLTASLFRRSHSNLILNFRLSPNLHLPAVHHFHRFSFLPLSKFLAKNVSINASLFR
jgi:hypothetical protein